MRIPILVSFAMFVIMGMPRATAADPDDRYGKEAISRLMSVFNHGSSAEANPELGSVSRLVSVFNHGSAIEANPELGSVSRLVSVFNHGSAIEANPALGSVSRLVSVFNHGSAFEANPALASISRMVSVFNARYFGELQEITFDPIADQIYGVSPLALVATASSGLPVGFRVIAGPAKVEDDLLTIVGVGRVTVEAFQEGDSTFATAVAVRRSFLVTGVLSVLRAPESIDVSTGDRIELRVEVAAAAPVRYQWRRNGEDLPGAIHPTYIVDSATLLDGGSYSVVVSNPVGATESEVAVVRIRLPDLAFADDFADAGLVDVADGVGRADNAAASREPGESDHAEKPGDTSMWLRWQAPESGVVTLSTLGSSFDTLLAVYQGESVDSLTELAADDDSAGFLNGRLRFNAIAGQTYRFVVDGFDGATGEIVLSWELKVGVTAPALATAQQPLSRTVPVGGTAVFAPDIQGADLTFQWLRNGLPLTGETSATLVLENTIPANAGVYTLEIVSSSGEMIRSRPASLDIGDDPTTLFTDKLADAIRRFEGRAQPGLAVRMGRAGFLPPVLGVPTTHYTDNSGATVDIGERFTATKPGAASLWTVIEAPLDATLRLDTIGSAIETTLAVYRSGEKLPLAEDSDGAPNGRSLLRVPVERGEQYFLFVDGEGGARGRIRINAVLGFAPTLVDQPVARQAKPGERVELSVDANSDSGDLEYQWYWRDAPLADQQASTLVIDAFSFEDVGEYVVEVSNPVDSVFSDPIPLALEIGSDLLIRDWVLADGVMRFEVLVGDRSATYTIESASALNAGEWRTEHAGPATSGRILFSAQVNADDSKRFYRIRFE